MPSRAGFVSSRASVPSVDSPRANATSRQTRPFSPEPQETPLNQNALVALENLKRRDTSSNSSGFDAALNRAAELLTEVVEQINDRAQEERQRRSNRLEKLKEKGGQEDADQKQQFDDFQQKIDTLNGRLDLSMRKVVDDQVWAEGMTESVKHVIEKSKASHAKGGSRRTQLVDHDSEEEMEQSNPPTFQRLDPSEHATALLQAAQSTAQADWNARTLTERYSQNETYSKFYNMRWDAQHPGSNPPPMPHHSMWFAVEEGRSRSRHPNTAQRPTQGTPLGDDEDDEMQDIGDDDTEVQIHSENISCKCPLTLVWFEEPVTSTKCPHSFEKSAIVEFIQQSDQHLHLTSEQLEDLNTRFPRGSRGRPQAEALMKARNPKCVACPVCAMHLTEHDLRDDPVLLRKTKRAKEAQAADDRDATDDDDEGDSETEFRAGIQGQRPPKKEVVDVGSSPAADMRRTLINPGRDLSVVPNSQPGPQGSHGQERSASKRGVMDIDDDDDDNNEDEYMTS